MGKKQVIHMFEREDIVRSVLKGHKVTSPCGYVTVHTREDVDAVPAWIEQGLVKLCTKCLAETNGIGEEVTIHPSRGWVDLLEWVWSAQYDAGVRRAKITFSKPATFPLAG